LKFEVTETGHQIIQAEINEKTKGSNLDFRHQITICSKHLYLSYYISLKAKRL